VSKRNVIDDADATAAPTRLGNAVVVANQIFRGRLQRVLEETERELDAAIRRATTRLQLAKGRPVDGIGCVHNVTEK
jgi:hypothetical protein